MDENRFVCQQDHAVGEIVLIRGHKFRIKSFAEIQGCPPTVQLESILWEMEKTDVHLPR